MIQCVIFYLSVWYVDTCWHLTNYVYSFNYHMPLLETLVETGQIMYVHLIIIYDFGGVNVVLSIFLVFWNEPHRYYDHVVPPRRPRASLVYKEDTSVPYKT